MTKNDGGKLLFRILAGAELSTIVIKVIVAGFVSVLIFRIVRYLFTGC